MARPEFPQLQFDAHGEDLASAVTATVNKVARARGPTPVAREQRPSARVDRCPRLQPSSRHASVAQRHPEMRVARPLTRACAFDALSHGSGSLARLATT